MSDDLSGFSLMDLFRSEAETHSATLSTGLLALEDGTPPTAAAIEPMMRAAHSLKGAARIVGVDAAVRVAHVMEDCFVAAQDGGCSLRSRHIDVLLRGVDLLTRISQLAESETVTWTVANEPLVASLVAEIEGILHDQSDDEISLQSTPDTLPEKVSGTVSESLADFSLMELFRSEAETHTSTLAAGLLALEGGARPSPAAIEPMMRAAHSLKGAARIVGLDAAVRIAHVMEDCFVAVQEGRCELRSGDVDVLLRAVDLLARVSQISEQDVRAWSFANDDAIEGLVNEIASITTNSRNAKASSPPVIESRPVEPPPAPLAMAQTAAISATATEEPQSPAPSAPEQPDRVVRVTADSLTRLMGLAGESLVQSHQLRPFVDSLLTLKAQHSGLLTTLQTLLERISLGPSSTQAIELELLTRARTQASQCSQSLGDKMEEFEDFARRSEDLSGRLHHEVLASRMRPLADGVRGFPRLVRDIAKKLRKKVQFEVLGENTGVDRDILEKLEAPLNHLIRNGLDHAIELPEERLAAGKPAAGRIRLEARHRAGMLQITLSDDGRGIDPERLRAKVVERGLATEVMARQLTDMELFEFLFLPGFSTKEKVTEISGRGVGLDVVQNMVREVGGVVRISSQLGQGTRFTLQLPITMSVVRALLVRVAGEPYAFPLNRIDRILVVPKSTLHVLEGRHHFMMDDQPVGLVDACQVLEVPAGEDPGSSYPVVVASDRSHRFGIVVDAFLGERDLEVRPLDPRLGKVPNINSASVLEDGWPVLIFDVEDLVRSVDNMLGGRRLRKVSEQVVRQADAGPRRVLVVDDSITVRELERQLLENQGYAVEVAVDGLDGWNAVRTGDYHLVISDVDMPRMDGIQLVTLIKQDARLRSIPVVIVSYKDREEDRMRGLDAGANSYLTKSSFHDRTFLETVVDLIGEATA